MRVGRAATIEISSRAIDLSPAVAKLVVELGHAVRTTDSVDPLHRRDTRARVMDGRLLNDRTGAHPQRRVVIIKAPNSQPPYPLSKRDGLLRRKDSCDGVSPAASVPADRARAWHTPAGHLARSASNPSWYEGWGAYRRVWWGAVLVVVYT